MKTPKIKQAKTASTSKVRGDTGGSGVLQKVGRVIDVDGFKSSKPFKKKAPKALA